MIERRRKGARSSVDAPQRRSLFIISAVAFLALVAVVDARLPTIVLAPLTVIPILVVAYYGGLAFALTLAVFSTFAFQYIDYVPLHSGALGSVTFWLNGSLRAIGLCSTVFCASLLQREARRRTLLEAELGAMHKNETDALAIARTDLLTGLLNRRGFDEEIERIALITYKDVGELVIAYIDLNGLKQINDDHGHHIGDAAIQTAAKRISAALRADDIVARIGGDEFVVLCRSADAADIDPKRIEQAVIEAFRNPMVYGSLLIPLAASVGTARTPQDGTTIPELLVMADQRMYRSKGRMR